MPHALALWIEAAGRAVLRETEYLAGPGEVEVRTLWSGISRGTERLVFEGAVPASEAQRMRAPMQQGDFSFPVKYGYCAVGQVASGPRAGEAVFVLHPHQARFACPSEMAMPLPGTIPAERAVLAANLETALNILWDSGASAGDRVVVVGAGVVGALASWLASRLPGADVTLVDVNPAREALARALGLAFALPVNAPREADIVIHASASIEGLATSLDAAGTEATVVEASWYGDRSVPVPLGGAFHSRRLRLVSSQVGRVPPHRTPRWDTRRRLALALSLLSDPALDALISGETAFEGLPDAYGAILADPDTLCHRVRY